MVRTPQRGPSVSEVRLSSNPQAPPYLGDGGCDVGAVEGPTDYTAVSDPESQQRISRNAAAFPRCPTLFGDDETGRTQGGDTTMLLPGGHGLSWSNS